jgi:hypothetical protein
MDEPENLEKVKTDDIRRLEFGVCTSNRDN